MTGQTLNPMYAGSWYPSEKNKLQNLLLNFFDDARLESSSTENKLSGIIAPHAGMRYSGATAAWAYKNLQKEIKGNSLFILLSPSHKGRFPGAGTLRNPAILNTPLGELQSAADFASFLPEKNFFHDPEIVRAEHAVELHLPFIHFISQGKNPVLPLVIGNPTEKELSLLLTDLAQAVKSWLAQKKNEPANILFIASSDLSHFHSAGQAEKLDCCVVAKAQLALEKNDPFLFLAEMEKGSFEACGSGAITILLGISLEMQKYQKNKNLNAKEFQRTHSGKISGDNSSVVGYLAAGIYLN